MTERPSSRLRPNVLHIDREQGIVSPDTTRAQEHVLLEDDSKEDDKQQRFGRTWHAFDPDAYNLPNDLAERKRLDIQHEILKLMFDGANSWVDISQSRRILDVGTGTGVWAIETARDNPQAEVLGIDLSQIQPEEMPSNCKFLVANAEEDWNFTSSKFDLIHARLLMFGMHDWTSFIRRSFEHLEPGGWIEIRDFRYPIAMCDEEEAKASPMIDLTKLWYDAARKIGIDGQATDRIQGILHAQGFINIERVDTQLPLGAWPAGEKEKKIGAMMLENAYKVVFAAGSLLQRALDYTSSEMEIIHDAAFKDLSVSHLYVPLKSFRAQKPSLT